MENAEKLVLKEAEVTGAWRGEEMVAADEGTLTD